ncbi:MAG: vitamin K epoxide reductase family protein [Planctomycetota bacterium]|nr:vitamin K epoxide reductase family protein [Planctomycetota bacterium]
MERKKLLVLVAGVLALIAAWTSGSLHLLHAEKDADLGLLAGICGSTEEGCASVVNSRWGVIPPGPAGSEGPYEGTPVALLGFLYYSILASWLLLVGIPDVGRQWLSRGVLFFNGAGVIGSLAYIGIMIFAIGTPCLLCYLTHGCNLVIFSITWLLRPRGPMMRGTGNPSNRLLVAACAAVVLACVGQFGVFEAAVQRARFKALEEQNVELQQLARDVEKLETLHRSQDKIDTAVRDDDPIIDDIGGLHYQLVIFSDVECPNCARFDIYLKETILPIWNGHLEVVWKHYPNTKEHPHAMTGAKALEAARLQGKFWQLRDWLLPQREALGAVNWQQAAEQLGMEPTRFLRDMASPAVARRIQQDVQLAHKGNVGGTPGVYLNGRKVSRLVRRSAGFWEIQSDSLREIIESRGKRW